MAYAGITEVHEGRQAGADRMFSRRYTRVFLVWTTSATDGPYFVGSHPSLPTLYSSHPEDPYAFCTAINGPVQDQGDPTLWRITYEYSYAMDGSASPATGNPAIDSQQKGASPASRSAVPTARPRDYNIVQNTYMEASEFDAYGDDILNSAGDPFLPPIELPKVEIIVTVGLNDVSAPSLAWLGAQNKTNANTITVGPYTGTAGKWKLNKLSAVPVYENNLAYWRWTMEWAYRADGWEKMIVDKGMREKTAAGERQPVDMGSGLSPSQPILLNGAGRKLPTGTRPYHLSFVVFRPYTFPTPI